MTVLSVVLCISEFSGLTLIKKSQESLYPTCIVVERPAVSGNPTCPVDDSQEGSQEPFDPTYPRSSFNNPTYPDIPQEPFNPTFPSAPQERLNSTCPVEAPATNEGQVIISRDCQICFESCRDRRIFSCVNCTQWICGNCRENVKKTTKVCPMCRCDLKSRPMKRELVIERLMRQ